MLDAVKIRRSAHPPAQTRDLEDVILQDDSGKDVWGATKGHAAQLGGVLIVAPDGSVRYAHLSEDASDNPSAREVIAAAKAIRPRTK